MKNTYLEAFKQRAEKIGLVLEYSEYSGVPNRFQIEIPRKDWTTSVSYSLLGLAHHFINRGWAKDISYAFINKSNICLTFTEVDYLTPSNDITQILENVVKYCEDQQIYDKLSKYGDFYYRIKEILD